MMFRPIVSRITFVFNRCHYSKVTMIPVEYSRGGMAQINDSSMTQNTTKFNERVKSF